MIENYNYVQVPATKQEDANPDRSTWFDGKYVMVDEGNKVTVFIDHTLETLVEPDPANPEEEITVEVMKAIPITIDKPLSRASLINKAEMLYYGLTNAMEVASFNASLARKARIGEDPEEVEAHDTLIELIKEMLSNSGINH